MSGSLNKVQLIGNLGRDPEIRNTQDGSKIATFSIATSERWRDKNTSEMRDKTEWHRIVVFNERLSDVCEKYLRKGTKVYVDGQLQTRKWTDNAGIEKYTTEVVLSRYRGELVMLDGRSNDNGQSYDNNQSFEKAGASAAMGGAAASQSFDIPSGSGSAGASDDLDDDIPF